MTLSHCLTCAALLSAGVLILVCHQAQASLSDEACADLATKYYALKANGIDDLLARNPATAVAELEPQQLEDIRIWFELKGDAFFRCPNLTLDGPGAPDNLPIRKPRRSTTSVALRQSVEPETAAAATGVEEPAGMPIPIRHPTR